MIRNIFTMSSQRRIVLLTGSLIFTISIFAQVKSDHYPKFKFGLDEAYKPKTRFKLKEELDSILKVQSLGGIDDPLQISYWNASYPAYRWHQVMMEIGKQHKGHKNGGRMAVLHLAIYDATVEVWKHKTKYWQLPPYHWNRNIHQMGREPEYSTFICEWSAAAGASREIIAHYFPEKDIYLDSLVEAFKISRLKSGLQFISDIEIGLQIGKAIAHQYIDYALTDSTEAIWTGKVPQRPGLWSGNPGLRDPMKAKWKPLTLQNAAQFRPKPHPDFAEDMAELRQFNSTHLTSDIAWKWKSQPIWDDLIERKILEYDLNPLEAAYANAMHHTARFDATIAAWDGKYYYWGIRPFQYDPLFKPILVETPNFPGYPAGHTTVAGAIATVLSFLFPQDKEMFDDLAHECSESRFEGGVHFRTDNEVGLEVGKSVGEWVIESFTR
jgi:hypothetical protein